MKLNDKMLEYLQKQMQGQEDAEGNLMYALACSDRELPSATKLSAIFYEVRKYNRYIRHVIQEPNCDHCKEIGLVD